MAGLRATLRPYVEKKSGSVVDAISLDIEGAGAGYGYRAASGGERRRVDVALLLALSEVGQAAQGQSGSTLFLDEVFDALDEGGVAALTDALADLAQDRCVFIISHNMDIIAGVRAAMRIHVEGGAAKVLSGEQEEPRE
jgi:DNA repair exonuclease SbcCD ATPase subunit